jgi:phage-related protein
MNTLCLNFANLSIYLYNFGVKQLKFIGSSQDDLGDFPRDARRECGRELDRVQRGLMPTDFKPLLSVGKGVYEVRVHVLGEWRVLYVARFADAVYVLHAFQKKTAKTAKSDIEVATRRYKQIGELL